MRAGSLAGRTVLAFATLMWTSCSGVPTAPTASGAYVRNSPPTIRSIVSSVARAEIDQDVDLVADIGNAAIPLDQLTYQWSADAGAITGTGPHVTWRLSKTPGAFVKTPWDVTVTLTVTERFREADDTGALVTRVFSVTRLATPFRVHDSVAELSKMGSDFLVVYFGNSKISPDACLVDFSNTCQGKSDEFSDIQGNRQNFVILSAQAQVRSITFDSTRSYADMVWSCSFHDRYLPTGQDGTSSGDCLLTGIYEAKRWWLCDSHFVNGTRTMGLREFFMRGIGGGAERTGRY